MQYINNNFIELRFKNSSYRNDLKISMVGNVVNQEISGIGVSNKSIRLAVLASLGEFFEREAVFFSCRLDSNKKIKAYSINENKIIEIDSKNIYLTKDSGFIDSCFVGSYTNSKDCIQASLNEFIERQSYILNYLSKGSSKKIDISNCGKWKYILNCIPNLHMYNISMLDGYYVIFAIGLCKDKLHIGMGADMNIDKAIFSCIKEAFDGHKYESKKNLEGNENYVDIFKSIPHAKVLKAYEYLDRSSEEVLYESLSSYKYNLEEICKRLKSQYAINPMIVYINSKRNLENLKIVKILDLNWFQTINPKKYTDSNYRYVEKAAKVTLDRKCNYLPFP